MVIASGSRVRPTHSRDGWVCDLGTVGVSSIFGWVRGTGTFTVVLGTFVLVSIMHLAQQYRDNVHLLSAVSSSRHKTMVDGALERAWVLRVGLGVGGTVITSGSRARPTHSCDRWVCDLGVVGVSSIFGWVRGSGVFTEVIPTFVLVSRMHLT